MKLVVFYCAVVMAFLTVPMAGLHADIRTTGHNLAQSAEARGSADATCVFCHTPRFSLASSGATAAGQIASWQRSLSRDYEYASTEPVTNMATHGEGSVSMVCLSCHDGTQAPWEGAMHQNHPIGMPFRGFIDAKKQSSKSSVFVAPVQSNGEGETKEENKAAQDYPVSGEGRVGDKLVWWVSASGGGRRQRNDLPLYSSVTQEGERVPYVECASCHDPHNTSSMFLRMSNAGSRLCMTCHLI